MTKTGLVNYWVESLLEARATNTRFDPGSELPQTTDQVYQIQAGVAQGSGAVGGFKTARKGVAAPIMAPIFAAEIVPSGAQVPVRDMLGIELEVGLKIVSDLPSNLSDLPLAALQEFLRPVVVIELVDRRVDGNNTADSLVQLADNQINGGLVVGMCPDAAMDDDISTVRAQMRAGSDQILDGTARVPGGSALTTFKALAQQIGTHCGGLKRGQIVITGSLHPLVYYRAGTHVTGRIEGIGAVEITLGAAPSPAT